jgi:protein SCO1
MRQAIAKWAALTGLAVLPAALWAQATEVDLSKGLYFDQKLGEQAPLDAEFRDETGKTVRFGELFEGKPAILVPVFYECQSSCLLIRDGLIKTLNALKTMAAGRDFEVIVLSINPKEKPEQAATKEKMYLGDYRHPNTEDGWHFLTGDEANIRKVTEAVGFGYTIQEQKNQETGELSDAITHPSGIIVLTPEGKTSLYLLGAKYPQELLRRGLQDAAAEKVGPATETILLGCFMYDPATGKYRLVVENALKVGGIATALILFGSIAFMSFKYRRSPLPGNQPKGGGA